MLQDLRSNEAAQRQAYEDASKRQSDLEFSRYKQDCRKRALDLAEKSLCESRKNGTFDSGAKDEDGSILPKEILEDAYLTNLADKYYNWLISIP